MKGSFARLRLHGLLMSQAFGAGSSLVACVADMIIAGNLVGVDALAGIAAMVPVVAGAQFVARLVYCGAGYLFAKHQGAFDPVKARQTVGLALEAAVAVGLLTYAVLSAGCGLYFDLIGITGAVRDQAVLYGRWMFVYCALTPVTMTMWRLVYADGETVTTAVADTLSPLLTIVLSVVFTKMTGTAAGAALGVLVGMSATDLVMMLHVFRKTNSVVPVWNFSWSGLRELVSYSLTDASSKLCQSGLMAILGKMVVFAASAAYLPVLGMIALVIQLRDLLDRVGDAYTPVVEMYLGEDNLPCVRELARHSLWVAVALGAGLVTVVVLLAPAIVALYGIPRGDVFDHSVIALRIAALALPFSSVLAFLASHYLALNRVALSLAVTVHEEFLLTSVCAVGFCLGWGLKALWIGLPVGCFMALCLTFAYCRFCRRQRSLLLIPDGHCAVLNQTYGPEAVQVVRARDRIVDFFRSHGVRPENVARLGLLAEECAMSVADHNLGSRGDVQVEASALVGQGVARLVMRDTGAPCDITDGDAKVTSLRSFVIAGLMKSYEDRRYLNTIGCNRAVFSFDNEISENNLQPEKGVP